MSVVLVAIITVAWMVILGPNLLKRRSRTVGGINSIYHFHRSLRTLERSSPQPIVTPAYRLRSVQGAGTAKPGPSYPDVAAVPVLTVVGADQLPRPALAFLGENPAPVPSGPDLRHDGAVAAAHAVEHDDALDHQLRPADALLRHQVRRRRRDTLGVLAMVFVGTLMIGFVPGASAAWVVSAVTGVALAGYVWLLVHLRQLAEERERKLRYLSPGSRGSLPTSVPGALGAGVPVYMSGRYAHPSNQAAVAH